MNKPIGIEVSLAAAEAASLANVDVVAAYPITPQTHVVEHLAELVAEGKLKAQYVAVESEHSAMSACVGASAAGSRTFTATASQGLALMHEILYLAPSMRLPIVMVVANRALSAPINIWADHSDIMPQRDTGWVQLFAENGQEVFDLTLMSFKLAEDHQVLLPVMVNMDGFTLSHVIEPVSMLSKEEADSFLPPMNPARMLDPEDPRSIGAFGAQDVYTEVKMAQEDAMQKAAKVFETVADEYKQKFGRAYKPVETYRTEDAKVILVTMGSAGETARTAVDEMRETGVKVGQVSIRMWRPFPLDQFRQAVSGAKVVAVLDRALSPGSQGGPVGMEVKSAFFGVAEAPVIKDFVAGLGGRELNRKVFKEITSRALDQNQGDEAYTFLDARLK
jgi:pyruvate ferredoxin oxidoreductase alpha subunit